MKIGLREIAYPVAACAGVGPDELRNPARHDLVVDRARGVVCYVAVAKHCIKFDQVASYFLHRDPVFALRLFNRTAIDLANGVPAVVSLVQDVAPELLRR